MGGRRQGMAVLEGFFGLEGKDTKDSDDDEYDQGPYRDPFPTFGS